MSRKGIPSSLVAGVAVHVAGGLAVGTVLAQGSDSRPNIVLIQTDDQTLADLDVVARTRGLIGDRGVNFRSTVTPFAICCPSRASMMTGSYPHNTGVSANFPPAGGFAAWERQAQYSIGSWLQASGYHTVHLGKYINGYAFGNRKRVKQPIGWSEWWGSADPSTYQMWGFRVNHGKGQQTRYGVFNSRDPRKYNTTVYTDIATGVITREARRPGPFYMQVAYLAPHVETKPLRKSINPRDVDVDEPSSSSGIQSIPPRPHPSDKDKLTRMPLDTMASPNFNEADVSDKGTYVRNLPLMDRSKIRDLIDDNRARKRSLLAVDRGVAKIVATLKKTGQYDNTVIVFIGDNGYLLGQHRIPKGKYFPYEAALRVPFLIAGPGIRQGVVDDTSLVSLIDVTPTLLDFAGVTPTGRAPDGVSLKPLLTGTGSLPARTMLLESGPQQAPNGDNLPLFNGVRTATWAWWRYEDGTEEMYDLVNDPWQLQSRAGDPAYANVRAALVAEWERLRSCQGASCQMPTGSIPAPQG